MLVTRIILVVALLVAGTARSALNAQDEVRAFVEGIYAGYRSPRPPSYLGAAARQVLSPSLLSLVRADQARAGGEVGALDHDPLCACQDASPSDLRVRIVPTGPMQAFAEIDFVNGDRPTHITLELVRLDGEGWRVADVRNELTPSLVLYLKRALGR